MAATQAPAGWYDDPLSPGGKRWWDGIQWTHQTEQPPPAPQTPAPLDLFAGAAGFAGHAGTSLLPATNDMGHSETYFAGDERPLWRRKRVLIPSLALLLGLGIGAVAIGMAVVGSDDTTETAAGGIEAAEGSADQQVNGLIGQPEENADSTLRTTSTVSPTTVRPTSSTNRSSTTEASTTTAASESTTPAAPATAAPTTAAPTTVAPTTAAPTTAAPTTAAPTTAAPTTAAPTTAAPTTAAPTTAAPTTAAPTTAAPTTAAPTTAVPTTAAPTTADCHPAYSPCLPNSPGDAYNCVDLSDSQKPVKVYDHNVDPYGLDADNDGVGCESG